MLNCKRERAVELFNHLLFFFGKFCKCWNGYVSFMPQTEIHVTVVP